MNADSAFQIGKDHTVCEDYAVAAVDAGLAYAIVCDGCSASPDVDLGARVMALSAKRTILHSPDFSYATFGEVTLYNAQKIFDMFPRLHPQALDTTLLVGWVKDKKLTVYMWGDGLLIHKTKAGTISVHIELSSGAPDYLSYHLDKTRLESYIKIPDNQKLLQIALVENKTLETSGKPLVPYVYTTPVEESDVISLCSDGINSFRKADSSPIRWQDLVNEFTGFKTTEGQFALRRISAFKRQCLKDGTVHTDDISIASIVV